MKSFSRRVAGPAILLLSLTALMSTSPAAWSATGRSWTTVGTFAGGKHQACKVSTDGGASWKIDNRLVNGNQSKVGAGMTVRKDGDATKRTWDSGLIAKGTTSTVGSVTIPRGDEAFTLDSYEYQAQSGAGRSLDVGDIGHC